MKKIIIKTILSGLALFTAVSCSKSKQQEFVGTPVDSQIMMLGGKKPVKNEVMFIQKNEEPADGELFNPWANESLSGNPYMKADAGEYDVPAEINIEAFRHIQRFSVEDITKNLEQAFDPVNGNPWVTKLTKDEKIIFESVPTDSEINEKYRTTVTVSGIKALRIPGTEGSPDLLELIDASNGNLKEVVVIPGGLPQLKVNGEFQCFEFSEDEKSGTVGGQLYIFPNPEQQKKINMGLVKFNTEEFTEPASQSKGKESIAQGSEILLVSRSAEKLEYEGKTSYWFQAKRGASVFWVPGYNLYLQSGTFNRLNVSADLVYVPMNGNSNWFRLSREFPGIKGSLQPGQLVYVSEISSGKYESNGRRDNYYRTSYPLTDEVFGTYLEPVDDIQGTYSLYPDRAEREKQYSTDNDPYVTIYEGPNSRYPVVGRKFDYENPQEEPVTVKVNGFTDIQDVVHDRYGLWYSVSSPARGFIFVEQTYGL